MIGWRYGTASVVICSIALGWPEYAPAQESDSVPRGVPVEIVGERAAFQIVYDHAGDTLVLRSPDGEPRAGWPRYQAGDAPLLEVAPDRPVTVRVSNANALLYGYEVHVNTVQEKSLRTCGAVGRQFTTRAFGATVGGLRGVGEGEFLDPTGNIPELGIEEYFPTPEARGARETLTRTTLQRTLNGAEASLQSFLTFADTVRELSRTLGDSIVAIARSGEYRPIEPMLDSLYAGIGDHLRDPAQLPASFEARLDAAAPAIQALSSVTTDIQEGRYEGGRGDPLAVEAVSLMRNVRAAAELANDEQLTDHLRLLQRARSMTEQTYHLAPSPNYRRIVLRLLRSNQFAETEPRLSAIPRLREGDVQMFTESVVSVLCNFSAGFVVMDHAPDYVSDPDGLIEDRARLDDRTTVAVMFHVALSGFDPIGALIGVGLGEDRRPDLYLGGSIRLLAPVLLNIGSVWQYERQLPGGLKLGDEAPEEFDADDFESSYESSLFVGVSLGL